LRTSYVVRRPVDNRYLVRERDRRRLRELGWVLLTALPVALALIAYVWVNLELAYLTGAARLAERGVELGLAPPDPARLLYAEESR
jgi:hypothetical protein